MTSKAERYPPQSAARVWIDRIADYESFRELDPFLISSDRLGFYRYEEKLREAAHSSRENEAAVTGYASVGGTPCVLVVMEPRFMAGTMGSVVGEKITRAFESAARRRLPVVSLSSSGGARMQEGVLSLMQMAKTAAAVYRHGRKGLLYLSVITDPTLGGVTASFVSLGDVLIGLEGARYGFTGKRIIEETTREALPEDFQTVEYAFRHGQVDCVTAEKDLRDILIHLLRLHRKGKRRCRI